MDIHYARRKELRKAAAFLNDCWRWAYKDIIDPEYLVGLSDKERHKKLRRHYKEGKRPLLLFSEQNELLGFCGFGSSLTEGYPEDGEISAIYVREDAVGQGYGHTLFVRAEEILYAQGYTHLVLDVLSQNTRAIAFYRAHGYVRTGDRQFKCGGREYPMDIMRK